ncbi:hypothetical protein ASZ90_018570 [hydrocarbon metagenome]|uniref:Uncharacterized protein n=1 Tax=hydrocarbon metagenome TaxID=938273 RepID=A0A0W8E613_9ZZZZ
MRLNTVAQTVLYSWTSSTYARFAVNQDDFNERHQGYMRRHRIATGRVTELEDQRVYSENRNPPACSR